MKAYKKAFALASISIFCSVLVVLTGMEDSGLGFLFVLLGLVAAGFGIIGAYGPPRARQWVEDNF